MNTERTYSPPFLIQMVSGEKNQQCDLLPHGSFHEVKMDENNNLWLTKGIHGIPPDYKTKVIENKPETKICDTCKVEYPKEWPFVSLRLTMTTGVTMCIRCYERKYIPHNPGCNRDEYRELLREELKIELNKSITNGEKK